MKHDNDAASYVGELLTISKFIEEALRSGATEIVLKNPDTGEEKTINISHLRAREHGG